MNEEDEEDEEEAVKNVAIRFVPADTSICKSSFNSM